MISHYLWIVSCGNTDVQFPIFTELNGDWVESRYVLRGTQIRGIHEKLLKLLALRLVDFPTPASNQGPGSGRDGGRREEHFKDFDLEIEIDDSSAIASYTRRGRGGEARLINIAGGETLECNGKPLPIYFPKVEPLLPKISEIPRSGADLSVVVLNTCRSSDRAEPIASGPLIAAYLAKRLNLALAASPPESTSAGDGSIRPNTCTWVNLLQNDERLEDNEALSSAFKRLHAMFNTWEKSIANGNTGSSAHILVTNTGGIAQLKEIVERTSTARYGEKCVSLYNRSTDSITANAPAYRAKFAEQIALRYHCAEALREQDWMSAYGIANRYGDQTWAQSVRDVIGPLLNLRGNTPPWFKLLPKPVIFALRLEAAWTAQDAGAAVVAIYSFLESVLWQLIERNPVFLARGIKVRTNPLGNQFLQFKADQSKFLWELKFGTDQLISIRKGTLTAFPSNPFTGWPGWLTESAGDDEEYLKSATLLKSLCASFVSGRHSLQGIRNSLSHGGSSPFTPEEVVRRVRAFNTLSETPAPFGRNFLKENQRIDSLLRLLSGNRDGIDMAISELQRITDLVSGRKVK